MEVIVGDRQWATHTRGEEVEEEEKVVMSSTTDFRRYQGPEAAPSIGPLHAALTDGRRDPLCTVATASPDPSQRRSPFASTRQRMRDVPSLCYGPVTCPLLPAALAVNLS